MEYPREIEKALLELAAIDDELGSKRSSIRKLELEVTLDACGAKDENGKLILTNDRQRDGAIAKMLGESDEFNNLGKGVGQLERERAVVQARLERLRLELKLHILEAEQRNHIAALKVADSIFFARTTNGNHKPFQIDLQEIDMPF